MPLATLGVAVKLSSIQKMEGIVVKGTPKKTIRKTAARTAAICLPKLKIFENISFYENSTEPQEYTQHILMEMGRLGLKKSDIETYSNSRYDRQVLSNLIDWMGDHPGEAYANLTDWLNIDCEVMSHRLKHNSRSKPRIEITAATLPPGFDPV